MGTYSDYLIVAKEAAAAEIQTLLNQVDKIHWPEKFWKADDAVVFVWEDRHLLLQCGIEDLLDRFDQRNEKEYAYKMLRSGYSLSDFEQRGNAWGFELFEEYSIKPVFPVSSSSKVINPRREF